MIKIKLFNFLSLAWVVIILTQVLRNEFSYIYLPLLLCFLLINIYVILQIGYIFNPINYISLHLWIFYILIIYISAITFFYGGLNELMKALPRMTLMPLTLIFFYNFISSKKQFHQILDYYIFFGLIGAISIIFQIFFGPLDFLVDTQEREKITRYASTLGSLTAFGGAVGIIMIVLLLRENKDKKNNLFKYIGFFLLSLAAIVTLSKAGLMNFFIVLFLLIFFFKISNKLLALFLISLSILLIYFTIPDFQTYLDASFRSLHIGEESHKKVYGIQVQTVDRLTKSIPKLAEHSIWNNIFGFGLIGGQGAFGLPFSQSGTTHNQYAELFNIGGVFLFINFISLFTCVMFQLNKLRKKDNLAELFFYCNLIACLNMFFFNGFIYQPVTSFVLWLSIVYVLFNEKNL